MKDFSLLEKKLGLNFKNKDLLTQAFAHRSFLNENPKFNLSNNERLEFLGDAVLEQVVTVHLFKKYPKEPEGVLTSWRAALVNSKMLAKTAKKLGFDGFLLLSQGEEKETGKSRNYILANTYEALIGSLYLDQGFDVCKDFISGHLITELPNIIKNGLFRDSKSSFQEKAQEKTGITPTYRVVKDWGPDHAKKFIVGVYLHRKLIAKGEGLSKQEAEEEAAKKALKTNLITKT